MVLGFEAKSSGVGPPMGAATGCRGGTAGDMAWCATWVEEVVYGGRTCLPNTHEDESRQTCTGRS